jgi:porin
LGGLRNTLAAKGVNLDVDVLLSLQGVNGGGQAREYKFGGSADYELNLDFGKLGLWPGGFLKIKAESQFGEFLSDQVGAIAAADADGLFPVPFDSKSALSNVQFTQFLAPFFGVFLGKLDVLGGDANVFADDHKAKFMNLVFDFNPVTLRTVPYSPLGAGFVVIPTQDVLFTFTALDTEGSPENAGFDTVFKRGTTLTAETRVTVKPFGLPGHQLVGGSWSDKAFVATEQGVGVFGRVGVADSKTNPIEQFYSIGFGGEGMIPRRARDTFGVGYYYLRVNDDLPGFLLRSHEQGVEIYYNPTATNWLFVTPDVQIIEPGRRGSDTAFLTGLRVQGKF